MMCSRKGLGNKKPTDGAVLSEKLVTDASKSRSSSFSSCSRSDSVANDRRNDSQFKCKEARSISASASGATGVHAGPSLKSAKNGNIHGVPVKDGGILSLPQSARSGLKTSVRKVVQQFKASKQLPNLLDPGSEIAGKDNYKILFPYELFKKLYSCDGVELFPFGLINCGNSCYANAVLQCLAFTRPLASYLLQGLHSKACQKKGWCFICEFECLILKAREGESPLSPIGILSRIQRIGSHLGRGTEEDAHEFFRWQVCG
ncbi:hypothetical protein L1049_024983 [Liquidambar formosana]|uniref:USP domain-containing protein n=1 Tax=Liquidambar formosana TaxID=63359 RepID=A0AAP0S1U9_LIQFO